MTSRKIRFVMLPKSLTVTVDGERFTIPNSDPRYAKALTFVGANDLVGLGDMLLKSNESVVLADAIEIDKDGTITVDGEQVSELLEDTIKKHLDAGQPVNGLYAFARRLKENPSKSAQRMLFMFLNANGHPIADDGRFVAYRRVRSDFKDIHSGTMDNTPGKIIKMKRSSVEEDPTAHCAPGLHVCAWSYLNGFGSADQPVVLVLVAPEHVVSVPNDYRGTKMRVCEFEVREVVTQTVDNYSIVTAPKKKESKVKKVTRAVTKAVTKIVALFDPTKSVVVSPTSASEQETDKFGTLRTSSFPGLKDRVFDGDYVDIAFTVGPRGKKIHVARAKVCRSRATLRFPWNRAWGHVCLRSEGASAEMRVVKITNAV